MEGPTEPSDWSFRPLREIDALLRCPICFEYFENSVIIPQCSHSFCSLCIRRYLLTKRQCPICSKGASESEVRSNRLLDQLVHSFTGNRQQFIDVLGTRGAGQSGTSDQCNVPLPPTMSQLPDFSEESQVLYACEAAIPTTVTLTRSISSTSVGDQVSDSSLHEPATISNTDLMKTGKPRRPLTSEGMNKNEVSKLNSRESGVTNIPSSCSNPLEDAVCLRTDPPVVSNVTPSRTVRESNTTLSGPSTPSQSSVDTSGTPSGGKVSCPVCEKQVSATFINSHLDTCLNKTSTCIPNNLKSPSQSSVSTQPFRRLPNFVCSVMNDKELRKRLKGYNLPSQGPRQVLIERLGEFVLRYNAQCESHNPKSMKEVAAEVEKSEREKTASKRGGSTSSQANTAARRKSSTDLNDIEQQRKAHEKAHADQYAQLIAQARDSRKRATNSKDLNPSSSNADRDTPPLSPIVSTTNKQMSATPTYKEVTTTPTIHTRSKPSTPVCRSHATPTSVSLTTPTVRPLATPNTRLKVTSTMCQSSVANTPTGSNSGAGYPQPRKLEVDDSIGFDNLSPLEEQEDCLTFDPSGSDGPGSEGSTPELPAKENVTVDFSVPGRSREVLAPNSPDLVAGRHESVLDSCREPFTVPESPGLTTRSLRRHSKRKHSNSKIRYSEGDIDTRDMIIEQDDLDFEMSTSKYRKKQRRC